VTDFDRDTRHGPDFNAFGSLDRSEEFLNRPSSSYLCYNLIEPPEKGNVRKMKNMLILYGSIIAFNLFNRPQALRKKFQFLLGETQARFPEQKIIGCVKCTGKIII